MTTLTLPSGLQVEGKRMQVKGMVKLAQANMKNLSAYDDLLKDCTGAVIDPGIYDFKVGEPVDWSKAVTGDRVAALLKLRCNTFGNSYEVPFQCPMRSCRHRWQQDLFLDQLPVRQMTEEAKAAFAAGNRYETRLACDGRTVVFQLSTGALEARMQKLIQRGESEMIVSLTSRILEIQDVPKLDKKLFIENMDYQDAVDLMNQFDEQDCGLETVLEVECPKCLYVADCELPLVEEFFRPRRKAQKAKTRLVVSSTRMENDEADL
jgi:hypothetical protein